jgi:hypothetical protein
MVMANTAKIMRAVDLVMPVSSAIVTGHCGVVNSISVVKGFLRRGTRVGGRRWSRWFRGSDGWFRVFLFYEGDGRWCVWPR